MTTVRKQLETQLSDDWAAIPGLASVRVIATERELDPPRKPTALIRQKLVGRAPAAPQGVRRVELLLTLISPHEDLDRAGDELEDLVLEVLDYLGGRIPHEDATAVAYGNRLAYDIPLHLYATKD